MLAVVMMTVVVPLSTESTLPTWQIMAVTFLSGMPGVISYYFQGKSQILLRAEGKNYVLTNILPFLILHLLHKCNDCNVFKNKIKN